MKKLFCYAYNLWLSKLVDEKSDPLVVLLDFLFSSSCKYCMAVRALVFGVGLGLANWFGVALVALALACTLGEKYWLCEVKHGTE